MSNDTNPAGKSKVNNTLSRVESAIRLAQREAENLRREARASNPYDSSPRSSDPWSRRDTRL